MESPADTIVDEREMMVSPNDGEPFLKKTYLLKPTFPISSIHLEPPLKLPLCFPSFPPKEAVKVNFQGWRLEQNDWITWVDHMAPLHQCTWKRAGIHEAIINSTYQIKRKASLVYGLSEKWCCETNTFVFPWGEATITLEDVMVLGGFSVLGGSVFSPLDSSIELKVQEKLEKERSELYKTTAKKALENLWLKRFKKSGSELEHQAFLAFWLSRYVFPEDCNVLYKRVIPIAIRLARGTRIALAPAVLACIYRDLSVLKRIIVASNELKASDCVINVKLKSPFHLVQVWAWERFLELRPVPNVVSYAEPRLALWNRVDGLEVVNVRSVFDLAGEAFMWRPYAMPVENWNFPKYYVDEEKWVGPGLEDELLSFVMCLRVTELVGLETREQYLPHRVSRQFGYDQDFPCSVAWSGHSSDEACVEVNSDRAWKDMLEELKNVKLYIPSRFSKADISTRYLKSWKEFVSVFKDECEPSMPKLKKAKCMDVSLPRSKQYGSNCGSARKKGRKTNGFTIPSFSYSKYSEKSGMASEQRYEGNDSLVPPGFPPKCSLMEAGGSKYLVSFPLSGIFGCDMKQKNVEKACGDNEKLPDQVQNLVSSFAETTFDTLNLERLNNEGLMDEDQLTLSELLRNYMKHKDVETRTCGDSEKLLDQVQNLASSPAETSVDTMKSKTSKAGVGKIDTMKSEVFGCYVQQKNVETRTCGDSENLSDQVQILASSPAETSVDTMKSGGLKIGSPMDETRTCAESADGGKLSNQAQNLISSIAENSVDTIKSEGLRQEAMLNEVMIGGCMSERNLTNVMGNSRRSYDDTQSISLMNRLSALKNRVSRLESIWGVLRANSSRNML